MKRWILASVVQVLFAALVFFALAGIAHIFNIAAEIACIPLTTVGGFMLWRSLARWAES